MIRLCYSTYGIGGIDSEGVLSTCVENHISDVLLSWVDPASDIEDRTRFFRALRHSLASAGSRIALIGTVYDFMDETREDEFSAACLAASASGAPAVSVFTEADPSDRVYEKFAAMREIAVEYGVGIALSTRGAFRDSRITAEFLSHFAFDTFTVLWEPYYTAVHGNESPAETVKILGSLIRSVILEDGTKDSCELIGDGDLPLPEIFAALRAIDYYGFVAVVPTPDRIPGIDDVGVLLTHAEQILRPYLGRATSKRKLYHAPRSGRFLYPLDMPLGKSVPALLSDMAEVFPDQPALSYALPGNTRTYHELLGDAENYARAFMALGIDRSTHVAGLLTLTPSAITAVLALFLIGAVYVPIPVSSTPEEIAFILKDSDARMLLTVNGCKGQSFTAMLSEMFPSLAEQSVTDSLSDGSFPRLRRIVTFGFRKKGCLSDMDLPALSEKIRHDAYTRLSSTVKSTDTLALLYEKTEKGLRGVLYTHTAVLDSGKLLGDALHLSTADRIATVLPLSDSVGLALLFGAVSHAATLSLLPYFAPKALWVLLNKESSTVLFADADMLTDVKEYAALAKTDVGVLDSLSTAVTHESDEPISFAAATLVSVKAATASAPYAYIKNGIFSLLPGMTLEEKEEKTLLQGSCLGKGCYRSPDIDLLLFDGETGRILKNQI